MGFNIPYIDKERVVTIGGRSGGLKLAEKLKRSKFRVVLIDENSYRQFPPLLYQVASSGLEYSEVSFPYRKTLQKRKNLYFRLAEVYGINLKGHTIQTPIGELEYDYLVVVIGTITSFFGNRAIEKQSLPMRTVEETLALRDTLLINLKKTAICTDPDEKQALLNIVTVGGGTTGVEISGALSEIKRLVLPKDYPDLGNFHMSIYLIEGPPKLLGTMSPETSSNAKRFLGDTGANIIFQKHVIDYKDGNVSLDDRQTIPTRTLLWVSGVKAMHFDHIEGELLTREERTIVNECNQVKGLPSIFAVEDIYWMAEPDYPNGRPQIAQIAIQQGELLVENLQRVKALEEPRPPHYRDLGILTTVGRNKAVADLNRVKLHGFTVWLVWMPVHLRSILGIKNKLIVLISWIWNYLTCDHSTRFILFIQKYEQDGAQGTKPTS